MLIALAPEPVGGTALRIPQFVFLAAETEPGTAGSGALRETVSCHQYIPHKYKYKNDLLKLNQFNDPNDAETRHQPSKTYMNHPFHHLNQPHNMHFTYKNILEAIASGTKTFLKL